MCGPPLLGKECTAQGCCKGKAEGSTVESGEKRGSNIVLTIMSQNTSATSGRVCVQPATKYLFIKSPYQPSEFFTKM